MEWTTVVPYNWRGLVLGLRKTIDFFSGFIERNTYSGMEEHYGHLASELLRVTEEELSRKALVQGRRPSMQSLYEAGGAQSPESPLAQVPMRSRLSKIHGRSFKSLWNEGAITDESGAALCIDSVTWVRDTIDDDNCFLYLFRLRTIFHKPFPLHCWI